MFFLVKYEVLLTPIVSHLTKEETNGLEEKKIGLSRHSDIDYLESQGIIITFAIHPVTGCVVFFQITGLDECES